MSPGNKVLQGNTIPDAEIADLLTEHGVGVLSMANDGRAYAIPMSFGYDGADTLYFLFAGHSTAARKHSYAETTTRASVLVFDVQSDTAWNSVLVEGELGRISSDEWDDARAALADNAYRPDLLTEVDPTSDPRVYALEIEERAGRTMPGT